jgi:hypothetical protein
VLVLDGSVCKAIAGPTSFTQFAQIGRFKPVTVGVENEHDDEDEDDDD